MPYWTTNVQGTRNVIDQCRAHEVGPLVHTSQATWCTVPTPLAQAAAATCGSVLRLTGLTRTHALSRQRGRATRSEVSG